MLDDSEHQEVWAGPSWSSYAFKVRSVLIPGSQDPSKSVLLHVQVTSARLGQHLAGSCKHHLVVSWMLGPGHTSANTSVLFWPWL
jgi:hypothetical protein